MNGQTLILKIEGMTCDGCADTVQRYLKQLDGVHDAAIDWQSGRGEVVFDPAKTDAAEILESRAFRRQYRAEAVSNEQ
jgi:copper chaperone CopZ